MGVKLVASNPRVAENNGKSAVQRGPFIYCLEQADLVGFSVFDVALTGPAFKPVRRPEIFRNTVVVLEGVGSGLDRPATEAPLYSFGRPVKASKPLQLRLVPYFTFNNRGDHAYTVWMPLAEAAAPRRASGK
jgi:hypothetical protein